MEDLMQEGIDADYKVLESSDGSLVDETNQGFNELNSSIHTSNQQSTETIKIDESDTSTDQATNAPCEVDLQQLNDKRLHIEKILRETKGEEGEYWYLIPETFYQDLMHTTSTSIHDLKLKLGKIDMNHIIDNYGNLRPEHHESSKTKAIPPEAFNILAEWFGINGKAPTRALIINELGDIDIEKYPPIFHIHNLSNKSTRQQINNNGNNRPKWFQFSKTQTFEGLYQTIKMNNFKTHNKSDFRIWFIGMDNIEDIPNNISLDQFINEIPMKTLVNRSFFKKTLKSQKVDLIEYHLLVENLDETLEKYPITLYLEKFDFNNSQFLNNTTGKLGLINLGNTCYMNSALQCLVHLPELNNYFFFNAFEKELNETNPLGYNGNMARAFASLINRLFSDGNNNSNSHHGGSAISPREFKYTIGQFSSMFHGYQQQDSQEFVSWLLDALHEDLNRIINKPYLEKPELADDEIDDPLAIKRLADICWDQYKQRNDSIIIDLFSGLYQSILVCPDCNKTSITYDPFNDLTLPLPINKKWYHTFTIVNLNFNDKSQQNQRIMKLQVELNRTSNFDDLIQYLSSFLKVPKDFLFAYEIFNKYFYQDFQSNSNKYKFMPISEVINKNDEVLIYIIPHKEDDLIIPVLNTAPEFDSSYNMVNAFAIPLFITISPNDVTSFGKIRGKLEQVIQILTKVDISKHYESLKKLPSKQYYSKHYFQEVSLSQGTISEEFENIEHPIEESDDNVEDSKVEHLSTLELPKPEQPESAKAQPDDEEYDSDISLADPEISGDYGFTIKYYEDDRSTNSKRINVPLVKPSFTKLPKLSHLLPETKYNYYHYPNYQEYVMIQQQHQQSAQQEDVDQSDEEDQQGQKMDSQGNFNHHIVAPTNNEIIGVENDDEDFETINKLDVPNRQAMATPSTEEVGPPIGASETGDYESNSGSEQTEELEEPIGLLFDSVNLTKPNNESNSILNIKSNLKLNIKNDNKHPEFLKRETMLFCEWDKNIYKELFECNNTWEVLPEIANPELEANKAKLKAKEKSTISLYDCLDNFNRPEILGDQDLWYCPRCKDHKQATKTIKLWSTGDILTIHLKRFQVARSFSDKIDITIDFPIEGLDMTKYISNDGQEVIYDLVGVDNHFGGLGGGHYTSSVYNFKDNKWYYFNDSHVSQIEDPQDMINGSAYLLFYRKRSSNLIGSAKLNELIENSKHEIRNKLFNIYQQVNTFEEEDMEMVNKKSKTDSERED